VLLHEAYTEQKGKLEELTKHLLGPQKEILLNHLQKLNDKQTNIHEVKSRIEVSIRSEYDSMLQNLSDEQARKTSVLKVDITNIQNDLSDIENLLHDVKTHSFDPKETIKFLRKYKSLRQKTQLLASKKRKSEIKVDHHFRNELEEQQRILDSHPKLEETMAELQNKIETLELEKKELNQNIDAHVKHIEEIDTAAKKEIQHWSKLTNKFSEALDEVKLKCMHCDIPLLNETVNTYCMENKGSGKVLSFGSEGSGHHYFIKYGANLHERSREL